MSISWVSEYAEYGKRAISFVTVESPNIWINVIKKLPYTRDVDEVEIFRCSRTGVTCYDVTVFLNSDVNNETDEQAIKRLFGENFLKSNLPYSTVNELGVFSNAFTRVGPSTSPVSKIPSQPIAPDDLFTIYDTIEFNNEIGIVGYSECYKDFQELRENITTDLLKNPLHCKQFNQLAKTHNLQGGSWLVMPRHVQHAQEEDPEHAVRKCRKFFETIVEEFVCGTLVNDYVNRVSFSSMKTIVKVSNMKTIYFDFVDAHPGRVIENDEEIFRADREVRKTFLNLVQCDLHASMKYKPDVFTACKLNTSNTNSRLTFYTCIVFDRKMEIAREP